MRNLPSSLLAIALPAWLAAGAATATGPDGAAGPADVARQSAPQELANLRQEVVLAGAIVNGNRLDVNRFVDERSAETLQEEVRVIWSRRPAPIHSSTRDGWLILAQVAGSSVETLELRGLGHGAEGRWSRLRRGDGRSGESSGWLEEALPRGSQLLKRIAHEDAGRRMTTLVATTSVEAAPASHEIASALNRKGFRIESRSAPSFRGEGLVFFLARGTEDIAVTISEHAGQRALVVHWGRSLQ